MNRLIDLLRPTRVGSGRSIRTSKTEAPPRGVLLEPLEPRVLMSVVLVDGGQTLGTAHNLARFKQAIHVVDEVGESDPVDAFKFTLKRDSDVRATLAGLEGNADLQLIFDANKDGFADDGDILVSSENIGTLDEAILTRLHSGKYFLRVVSVDGVDTPYELSLTARAVPLPSDRDASLAGARPLGRVLGDRIIQDQLGGPDGDLVDTYRIDVTTTTALRLDFALDGQGAADVSLLNAFGAQLSPVQTSTLVASSRLADSNTLLPSGAGIVAPRASIFLLNPGVYFIQVRATPPLVNTAGAFDQNNTNGVALFGPSAQTPLNDYTLGVRAVPLNLLGVIDIFA